MTLADTLVVMNQGLIARLPGHAVVKTGDKLPLSINAGMTHLFDAKTGRRIRR